MIELPEKLRQQGDGEIIMILNKTRKNGLHEVVNINPFH